MPGCWACDEMGAAFAGVFWGVLEETRVNTALFIVVARGGRYF
jgi:hypothetical protein